ncbi:MAG: hypothetical protein ACOYJ1_09055 [Peptococcales bacterium]
MAGYVCTVCQRKTKLPDFCCGTSMAASGSYYCPNCKNRSPMAKTCDCGENMIQI